MGLSVEPCSHWVKNQANLSRSRLTCLGKPINVLILCCFCFFFLLWNCSTLTPHSVEFGQRRCGLQESYSTFDLYHFWGIKRSLPSMALSKHVSEFSIRTSEMLFISIGLYQIRVFKCCENLCRFLKPSLAYWNNGSYKLLHKEKHFNSEQWTFLFLN